MKNNPIMNIKTQFAFKLFAISMIIVGLVEANQLCLDELQSWSLQNHVCYEHAVALYNLIDKLSNGVITIDKITVEIAHKCEEAKSAECYTNITIPFNGACNEIGFVQQFRNAFKIVTIFNNYMCQNNGQKYLDFVKNGGSQCYFNKNRARCFEFAKAAIDLNSNPEFSDRTICPHLNAELSCIRHYNNCENQNVGTFYREIIMLAREKFSC